MPFPECKLKSSLHALIIVVALLHPLTINADIPGIVPIGIICIKQKLFAREMLCDHPGMRQQLLIHAECCLLAYICREERYDCRFFRMINKDDECWQWIICWHVDRT